jgi:hypothetical protein
VAALALAVLRGRRDEATNVVRAIRSARVLARTLPPRA